MKIILKLNLAIKMPTFNQSLVWLDLKWLLVSWLVFSQFLNVLSFLICYKIRHQHQSFGMKAYIYSFNLIVLSGISSIKDSLNKRSFLNQNNELKTSSRAGCQTFVFVVPSFKSSWCQSHFKTEYLIMTSDILLDELRPNRF